MVAAPSASGRRALEVCQSLFPSAGRPHRRREDVDEGEKQVPGEEAFPHWRTSLRLRPWAPAARAPPAFPSDFLDPAFFPEDSEEEVAWRPCRPCQPRRSQVAWAVPSSLACRPCQGPRPSLAVAAPLGDSAACQARHSALEHLPPGPRQQTSGSILPTVPSVFSSSFLVR